MIRREIQKREAQTALVTRIVEGSGTAPNELRRNAFNNVRLEQPLRALINKVALNPTAVTDDELGEAKTSGFTEDQLFELIICAAVGQWTREYEAALVALESAMSSAQG